MADDKKKDDPYGLQRIVAEAVEKAEAEGWQTYDTDPPLAIRRAANIAMREKRIAIANVLRSCRRRDGRHLSDVAVAQRVGGVLPSDVAEVRRELEEQGVLKDELEGPPADLEGGQS